MSKSNTFENDDLTAITPAAGDIIRVTPTYGMGG